MVLRAVPTVVDVAPDESAIGAAALVERDEAPAFDLAAYAKGLEASLRAARERLRAADASVASIRSGIATTERDRAEATARAAHLEERLRLSEELALGRDALAETLIAVREAYARARQERAEAVDEIASLRESSEAERDAVRLEREAARTALLEAWATRDEANQSLVRAIEKADADRTVLLARYVALVDEFAETTRAMARATAEEIDAIQSGRLWRVKRVFARLFGRATSAS